MLNECFEIRWKLLILSSLISPTEIILLEKYYIKHSTQCFITRWNMHLEVRQKYSVACRISTLFSHCMRLMLDIILKGSFSPVSSSCLLQYLALFPQTENLFVIG